jgi:hypothetical protein
LFNHETEATTVELHWRLAPRFFGASFDTSRLWQSTRRLQLQGSMVRVPPPEDLILMLCIHGAKDCWEKLEWVCGLAELIRSEPRVDWQGLLEYAQEIRCEKILSLGLLLVHELLNAPVPANVLSQLRSRRQLDSLVDKVATRFFSDGSGSLSLTQRVRFHLGLKDSLGEKFRYCARLALTTTPVDWEIMPLPESASFLYLPLRVLRLLRKYGGENGRVTAKRRSIGPA